MSISRELPCQLIELLAVPAREDEDAPGAGDPKGHRPTQASSGPGEENPLSGHFHRPKTTSVGRGPTVARITETITETVTEKTGGRGSQTRQGISTMPK
jgi:hypothetical protein